TIFLTPYLQLGAVMRQALPWLMAALACAACKPRLASSLQDSETAPGDEEVIGFEVEVQEVEPPLATKKVLSHLLQVPYWENGEEFPPEQKIVGNRHLGDGSITDGDAIDFAVKQVTSHALLSKVLKLED